MLSLSLSHSIWSSHPLPKLSQANSLKLSSSLNHSPLSPSLSEAPSFTVADPTQPSQATDHLSVSPVLVVVVWVGRCRQVAGFVSIGGLWCGWTVVGLWWVDRRRWAVVGRSASVGFIGVGWVHWHRWVVVWLVCCGGSSGFRGGGCGCCLVGRVGVGLVDFFFLSYGLWWWWWLWLWLCA